MTSNEAPRCRTPIRFLGIAGLRLSRIHRLAIVFCALVTARSAPAQERPDSSAYAIAGTDSATVARFIAQLQHAAATNDSVAIADLIDYENNVGLWDGRQANHVSNRRQFLRAYHKIFDRQLRAEIATVTPDSLFANYQGVMFNRGRVWAYPSAQGQLLIITINEPIQRWLRRRRSPTSATPR